MKKILSIALALMLVASLFAFTSCGEKEPKEMLQDADKALSGKPYVMTMKMNFNSDNADMKEVFEMMNMEIPVTIDGNNMAMDMSMDLMGQTISTKFTLVDKSVFMNVSAAGMSVKQKATLNDEQIKEFIGENGAEMPVDYTQFANLAAEKKDGKTVITCTGITDEGKKAINDEMASSLESLGGTATLGDLSYVITLKDGKYESMNLTCSYTATVMDESITVSMTMGATYSYDNVAAVAAPSDAADYTEVSFDDIMGGGM